MKDANFSHQEQSIMILQSLWDALCPVMGAVEVKDFRFSLGMNSGHSGMPASVYWCSCIPLGNSCVSMWREGGSKFGRKVEANSLLRWLKISLSEENKRDWKSAIIMLEITEGGEIRAPRFSSIANPL